MTPTHPSAFVDPRGVRFGGALTSTVAAAVAVLAWPWLAGTLAVLLLASAAGGARWSAWAYVFRWTARPFLGAPAFLEPAAPPRFANLLGGAFVAAGTVFLAVGPVVVGQLLLGTVAALALLNAAANFCVGCRLYGLLVRARPRGARARA